ncbi:MAG: hypothetical protein AB1634_09705 [Thermodesulfobacteriota bacterium]
MARPPLHFVIRTPGRVVLEADLFAVRIPTVTGQVGLRPGGEPCLVAVEPGLVLLRAADAVSYAGTAGGLLRLDGGQASLLTPLAVVGGELAAVIAELDQALALPGAEQEARVALGRLERSILQEMGREARTGPRALGEDR